MTISQLVAKSSVQSAVARRARSRLEFVPLLQRRDRWTSARQASSLPSISSRSVGKSGREESRFLERNEFIAGTYVADRERYGKTIIFADRWFQCEAISEALRARGMRAGVVYSHVDADPGGTDARNCRDKDENARVFDQFRRDELDVIAQRFMDLPQRQVAERLPQWHQKWHQRGF